MNDENSVWLVKSGGVSDRWVRPDLCWFASWLAARAGAHAEFCACYGRYAEDAAAAMESRRLRAEQLEAAAAVVREAGLVPSFLPEWVADLPGTILSFEEWSKEQLNSRSMANVFSQMSLDSDDGSAPNGVVWIAAYPMAGERMMLGDRLWFGSQAAAQAHCDTLNHCSQDEWTAAQAMVDWLNEQARATVKVRLREAQIIEAAGLPVPFPVVSEPQLKPDLPAYEQWRVQTMDRGRSVYVPTRVAPPA